MGTQTKHIKVKSEGASKRIQALRDKKKLVEKCVEAKDLKTLKDKGIEFARPFSV